jgi:hypothetical protein
MLEPVSIRDSIFAAALNALYGLVKGRARLAFSSGPRKCRCGTATAQLAHSKFIG